MKKSVIKDGYPDALSGKAEQDAEAMLFLVEIGRREIEEGRVMSVEEAFARVRRETGLRRRKGTK